MPDDVEVPSPPSFAKMEAFVNPLSTSSMSDSSVFGEGFRNLLGASLGRPVQSPVVAMALPVTLLRFQNLAPIDIPSCPSPSQRGYASGGGRQSNVDGQKLPSNEEVVGDQVRVDS
ncbi:hypothetical protein LTS18_014115, partial [Coniosporium uncinatum]